MKGILVLITTLLLSSAAGGGEPVRVIDGDGLEVGEVVIRLWGIDAPELDQTCDLAGQETPCGEDARFVLAALVAPGGLVCETKDTDRYGRTIAQCFVAGRDLAGELVRQGYALDWARYSGGYYDAQEEEARKHRRGLWAGEFAKPWEWRKR